MINKFVIFVFSCFLSILAFGMFNDENEGSVEEKIVKKECTDWCHRQFFGSWLKEDTYCPTCQEKLPYRFHKKKAEQHIKEGVVLDDGEEFVCVTFGVDQFLYIQKETNSFYLDSHMEIKGGCYGEFEENGPDSGELKYYDNIYRFKKMSDLTVFEIGAVNEKKFMLIYKQLTGKLTAADWRSGQDGGYVQNHRVPVEQLQNVEIQPVMGRGAILTGIDTTTKEQKVYCLLTSNTGAFKIFEPAAYELLGNQKIKKLSVMQPKFFNGNTMFFYDGTMSDHRNFCNFVSFNTGGFEFYDGLILGKEEIRNILETSSFEYYGNHSTYIVK